MVSPEDNSFKASFRETEPISLWSARLGLKLPYADFERTIRRVAAYNNQRYTGFIAKDIDGDVTSFTGTRYPRKKYGVATIDECRAGMLELANSFGSELQRDQATGFRVVMGLIEGYDNEAAIHTVEEVQRDLLSARVSSAEVFAIRLQGGAVSVYTEPVAVIEGPLNLIKDVYLLGDRLRQERFTIEDFDDQVSYVVETRFCTEPD